MACHGCHQPADYDARPPRSREHPWSCERQTHVFSIAMLIAVETSSPLQRARKRAEVFQQMAELAALQVGHHSSTPAHPNLNKGKPGAGQTCTNISRHAQPVARARPTTHARLHPAAAQRSAAWRKPKRRKRQGARVCTGPRSNRRRHLRTANAYQG